MRLGRAPSARVPVAPEANPPSGSVVGERPEKPARPSSVLGEPIPDLTRMPGVSIVSGDARLAAGAASRGRR